MASKTNLISKMFAVVKHVFDIDMNEFSQTMHGQHTHFSMTVSTHVSSGV